MKGIILAGGYGTRFLPVTKTVPKEMLPLVDRPAIDFILDEFENSGVTDVLVVSSRRKKSLEDYLDREVELESVFSAQGDSAKAQTLKPRRLNVAFVRQTAMLGTGHALLTVAPWVGNEPVVVAYPDDLHHGKPPLALQLVQTYESTGHCVLAALDNPPHLERYGVIKLSEGTRLVETIVEKPAPGTEPSSLASIGRYLYTPGFFAALEEGWKRHSGGEYYHVWALQRMMENRQVTACTVQGERWDTGDPLGYLESVLRYALTRPEWEPFLRRLADNLFLSPPRGGFQKSADSSV